MDIGFGIFLVTLVISQLVSLRLSWISLARREAQHEHDVKIGKVSGLLSHDLRNKIGAVSALIDSTALAPETKDKIASLLGRIKGSVELHLKQAVASPTPVSERDRELHSADQEQAACSIGGVVQTCIDDLKNACAVEIVADISRKAFTAFVPVEYSEMSRCVTNILVNAIEAATAASPNSKVYLFVHVSSVTCEVVIKDHGKGFSGDVLNDVMAGTRSTTKPGGTGLGIISAKTILERSKGDLKISSSQAGTVARLLLPRSAPPSWFFNIANSSAKELVVLDDDITVHDKVRRLFPEKKVFATTDETQFLTHMQAHPNALALVDFDFGGSRSGLDVLSEIKNGVLISGRISFDAKLRAQAVDQGTLIYPKESLG